MPCIVSYIAAQTVLIKKESDMHRPISTVSRHWYVRGGLIYIVSTSAALALMAYAPEVAAVLVEWLK